MPAGKQTVIELLRETGTALLDTILPDNLGHSTYLFTRPRAVIEARKSDDVDAAFLEVQHHVDAGRWLAGFVAYEAGYAFEPGLPAPGGEAPLLWFGVYDEPQEISREELTRALSEPSIGTFSLDGAELGVTESEYLAAVGRIREHIREGDVYQINYTTPLRMRFGGDPLALYRHLRRRQPVPYAAYIQTDSDTILSLSPELFFMRDGDRIVTRPMKGTAPVGRKEQESLSSAKLLRQDPKNRAENLMIVDLLRNDLSVCCVPGSVKVSELFGVHHYPTVLQMTSTVEGTLQSGTGYPAIFRSLFPSGSVTGAPKIRAMELIRDIEPDRRGVYCGALGYIAPGRRSMFNVAIRTVTISGSAVTMGTGSGIVWDSRPDVEYQECLLKTRFLTGGVAR